MSVRCKLSCNYQPGKVGADVYFNAVYEGSEELQKVSENAVFGNATPNGQLSLYGYATPFAAGEDYYVDLYDIDETPDYDKMILTVPMFLSFVSDYNPNYPDNAVQFRFVTQHNMPGGSLFLGIKNPDAINRFRDQDGDFRLNRQYQIVMRLARGRRSEAEIEVRRRKLEEFRTNHSQYFKDNPEHLKSELGRLERKLAIAEGAD